MAVVTRDSSSVEVAMSSADINDWYVSGRTVVVKVRRERSRSLSVCSALSWGRFGVSMCLF